MILLESIKKSKLTNGDTVGFHSIILITGATFTSGVYSTKSGHEAEIHPETDIYTKGQFIIAKLPCDMFLISGRKPVQTLEKHVPQEEKPVVLSL